MTTAYIRGGRGSCTGVSFSPDEIDFVQKFLSVWLYFVFAVKVPLVSNPLPERHVSLVPLCHVTMAIASFKCNKLFILLMP
jgi:hypothetical protein